MNTLQENIHGQLLNYLDPVVKEVLQVGKYILSSSGKYVRPSLLIYTANMFDVDIEKVVPLAVGLEYIHVASLLHDDVVDNAQMRRGKPSAHTIFGNQVCILTGDYMYAKALNLYSTYGNMESINVLSQAVMQMSQAQVLELKSLGDILPEETYYQIIDGKTGALIGAAMAIGAILGGRKDYMDFYKIGILAGRAFQMVDDALDYVGNEEKLGKPVGNDIKEGKCTYPLISVIDKLDKEMVKKSLLTGDVGDLIQTVINLGGVSNTFSKAKGYIEEVKSFLKEFKNSEDVVSLIELFINRDK